MIYLSDSAAKEIKRLQMSQGENDSYLVIRVEKGGCCGLYYSLSLTAEKKESDRLYQSKNIEVLIESGHENYLEELNLDYSEDLMGGSFRFHNPKADTHCSCGQSFS